MCPLPLIRLSLGMLRHLKLLGKACLRSFHHGVFMTSKGAAYSSILTFFPGLIVAAWVLAATHSTDQFIQQIEYALGAVLPADSRATALGYFTGHQQLSLRELLSALTVMVMAASGVMISWMNGFRRAYDIDDNDWNFWEERGIALLLVVFGLAPMVVALTLVAFGDIIEQWLLLQLDREIGLYVLLLWKLGRWLIATITSVSVIMLIYHWGLPRVQRWHRVLPGAIMATLLWFPVTVGFGWYVTHYANYNRIYGSLGAGIALLVWLYIISIIILIGAEYNALACPRCIDSAPQEDLAIGERRRAERRRRN
jgi:membrane protein